MGALLQHIGETPDDQITTEAQGRSSVIKYSPDTPQLLCRLIDQPGDLAISLPAPNLAAGPSGRRLDRDRRTARQSAGEPKRRELEVS